MSNDIASDLLQRGLTAMDIGDNEVALDYLSQAVTEDPDLLEAWEALSKLESGPEKETALQNVLRLDPDNKEAQKALNKLNKRSGRGSRSGDNEEWVPGIKRRQLRRVLIALTIFTIVIFGGVFAIIGVVTNQRRTEDATATAQVMQLTSVQSTFVAEANATSTQKLIDDANATSTQLVLTTATPTATSTSVLPPTFTPTAEATEILVRQFELPPGDVPGTIYAWGGLNAVSRQYLDLRRYTLGGSGSFTQIVDTLSSSISVNQAGTIAVYERYLPAQDLTSVYRVDLTDPQAGSVDLSSVYAAASVFGAFQPKLSRDGSKLVFIGSSLTTSRDTVLVMDMTTEQITVVTRDQANYRYPAISADGSYVAAVREDDTGDIDMVLFDLSQEPTDTGYVTVDLTIDGAAIIEAYPSFSADSTLLAYSAAASSTPNNHEIFLIGLDNGQPTPGNIPLATSEFDEIRPIFSPDGGYIAYSANPSGSYNIYIRDLNGTDVYQLTEENANVFVGAWTN
ncbi:PD40 domain-containing protein [Phototrophicus methaneseepsis]|uniref:PD40 domain-containing protein n=1 Tax=Phototrophicus methaneseepsis TaxID=2710758 RepID=A0A7S8ECR2_9CHLR|nr:PD40 domain-containing protein [Phototrophicus methaneseepsis]QPC84534.1 PD40 domain-containing protein [Phototrophicus methaneseepsis]